MFSESRFHKSVLTIVLITYKGKTSPSSNTEASWENVFLLRLLPNFYSVSQKVKDGTHTSYHKILSRVPPNQVKIQPKDKN